jgi:carbon-monoxide dehydrogenase large subunit
MRAAILAALGRRRYFMDPSPPSSDRPRMNIQNKPTDDTWALAKFGVGQPVTRKEDPVLVQGQGTYTDDIALPGQAYAVMVRSAHAHGVIRSIDITAAKAMPGVLGVYTGHDLAGYGPIKCALPYKNRDGSDMHRPPRPALPTDKVRFVGDPVACVVAETLWQARDAAEAVTIDIDPLPAVTRMRDAVDPSAPLLYDDVPNNLVLDYHYGDSAKVADAFAKAAHVTRLDIVNTRVVVSAMEPRAAIGVYDGAHDHWTLHVGCQGAFGMRNQLVDMLRTRADKVRVLTQHVGGSFGMKAPVYPEYICVLHAARQLGRPVKWADERTGSFVSDHHGRDHEMTAELALDRRGRFLAIRLTGYGNMGGYLGPVAPLMVTLNAVKNTPSVYRTPLIEVSAKCVLTNTSAVSAYRGAGRPEGNYYMERLIDRAAAEMGIDRLEMRRRNHIRPEDIPFAAASGMTYDSGDFPALFERALIEADVKGFAARRKESRKRGRLRGLGIGSYLEVTAPPNPEMGGISFDADGGVTIVTGTLDYGQGHATPFAQVLSDRLGIPFDRIRLLQGDSDALIAGGGTGGSRSIMASGAAIIEAAAKVVENGRAIAAHVLEAAIADIEFSRGRFIIAGTDRAIGIMELADRLRAGLKLPDDVPQRLDVSLKSDGVPSAFPNGCHVAEVEIDPDTGVVTLVKYSSVNDFGTLVNPLLVEGQVHGGVVQALGQALLEHAVYDDEGQLLTGSYMDYALPRAKHAPMIGFASHPVPAKTNPLGAKGCGEAGCAGGLVSIMNAVVDALSAYGITHFDMPASPARIWAAIRDAKDKQAREKGAAGGGPA